MMRKKQYSIDRLSTASARKAQAEAAFMQSEIKKLRASLLNMGRGVNVPVIRARRTWTKRTKSASVLTDIFGTTSGYTSTSQTASQLLESFTDAQKIR